MAESVSSFRLIRFGIYEVDLQTGELRKGGVKLKLGGQPFQVLAILLERPGDVFSRDELQKRLWPDTFVDVDHNLNTAINKIREVLGDSSESPRFVETLSRRGYRFIAPVDGPIAPLPQQQKAKPSRPSLVALLITASLVLLIVAYGLYKLRQSPAPPVQRALTRLTFDDGLQIGATWSPDGRFLAYSSDRGGKFDIWVQQVSGGDPIQITKGPGQNWQPDWSPDGKYIAYRSEVGDGGLYIIPALGGLGLQQRIASFGYFPQWSPDGTQILFRAHFVGSDYTDHLYVVGIDGSPPRQLFAATSSYTTVFNGLDVFSAAWHPDGKRITFSAWTRGPDPSFWTIPIDGGSPTKLEISPGILKQLGEVSGADGTN